MTLFIVQIPCQIAVLVYFLRKTAIFMQKSAKKAVLSCLLCCCVSVSVVCVMWQNTVCHNWIFVEFSCFSCVIQKKVVSLRA